MVIFWHCCSFEQLLVIFLEIILHMPLEMQYYTASDVQNQTIDILGD